MPEKDSLQEALDTPGGEWRNPDYKPASPQLPPKRSLEDVLFGKDIQLRKEAERAKQRDGHLGRNEKLHQDLMKEK